MSTWQGLTIQMRYNYFNVFVKVNLVFIKTFWTWPQSSVLKPWDFSQDKNCQSATDETKMATVSDSRFGHNFKTVAMFKLETTPRQSWEWPQSQEHKIFEATVSLDKTWPHSQEYGNFQSHSFSLKIWPHSWDCGHEKARDFSYTVSRITTVLRT